MEEAGVEPAAIAAWKLSQLQSQRPELAPVLSSAQSFLSKETISPQGLIPSQLAEELTSQLGQKVTAAQVNQALHELGLQEYARPGKGRERKLTAAGKNYGVAVLATSAGGWQGCQIRWRESVLAVLGEYFEDQ
jgi:hypothetical protein